ncbi:MAG TPA: tetratricopeptide repeat protein, partial [Chthonomonadaceae bacterium]|nr:tetratricopeptide repeat protein [Chthonomonadaceae bacterium]
QYQELERVLREQLGAQPSRATRALAVQIRPVATEAAVPLPPPLRKTDAASALAPSPALPAAASRLPLPLTRFFGREEELARLQEMLLFPTALTGSPRLLTLLGPGGTGKTRLAIELARRLAPHFEGVMTFVDLSDRMDARLLPDAIAEALRLPWAGGADPLERVVAALGRQPSLLLLDNFEQIAAEGAPIVQALLERAPALTCLVTSRQSLNLPGEQEFSVPPLPAPERPGTPERLLEFASVQLFVDRARSARADFQVTDRTAAAVAALCHRLEGLPLAIELAAAWSRTLTPAQLLERLSRRFDTLVSRKPGGAARHQTLKAAIDWSYRSLSPDLQALFARLSVFRGGWTEEAAAAVCLPDPPAATRTPFPTSFASLTGNGERVGQSPTRSPFPSENSFIVRAGREWGGGLGRLLERSLIVAEESGDQMRFRMLETLREYAEEQLSAEERARMRRLHAEYYRQLVEETEASLYGPEMELSLDRLEAEIENLRAALAWCAVPEGEAETGLRMAAILWRFWAVRGYFQEGRRWLSLLLSRCPAAPERLRARALNGAGILAEQQGDHTTARDFYAQSLEIERALGDHAGISVALNNLGNATYNLGDYEAARALYSESLDLRRQDGDRRSVANILNNLGLIAQNAGDDAAARRLYEESLALKREIGDRAGIAVALNNLGMLAYDRGEYVHAQALYEESLAISREQGHRRAEAIVLNNQASVARCQGEHARAWAISEQSLAIKREVGDRWGIAYSLEAFAALAAALGQAERAAKLFGTAEALREALSAPLRPSEKGDHDRAVASAQARLPAETFAAAWTLGRALTLDQAIAFALESPVTPTSSPPAGEPTPRALKTRS